MRDEREIDRAARRIDEAHEAVDDEEG